MIFTTELKRLQLGLSTYSFPWAIGVPGSLPQEPMTATALLQYAAKHNIRCVQFGDNLPLHTLPIEERNALAKLAETLGLTIEVGTRRLTEEQILLYLPIAQQFRSAFIRVVIDDAGFQPGEEAVTAEIDNLLPHLRRAGTVLAIENHDRFPAKTLKRIIENTDPSLVGICLDTANSLGAGEGVHEVLDALAPYTVNLHIKDISIARFPHKMGLTVNGCPAGQGQLNIPGIIQTLNQYGRCKTATLEVWSQPEKSIAETIAKERTWVEQSIAYLNTLLL